MNKFITGDHVTVINDQILPGNEVGPNIQNGQLWPVIKTHTCACGEEHVDIGILSTLNYVTCYKCEENLPESTKIHWCHSSRFEKVIVPGILG